MTRSRYTFESPLIERGTLPALAAAAVYGSILIVGCALHLVQYRGDELNPIFGAVSALWLSGILCQLTRFRNLGAGIKATAIFFLMTVTAALSTIVLAKTNVPYTDALFAALDRMLFPGFDWSSAIVALDQNRFITRALDYSYPTLFWQPELLLIFFCATDRSPQAWRVLSALTIALVLCIAVFPFCPAIGGYAYFGIGWDSVPNVHEVSAWRYPEILEGVRQGRIDELGLKTLEGVVAMPSFHASAAVILAWGFWPSRLLRWPFLALNVMMLVSSIPIGGHYIVDVLAGMATAYFAIWLVRAQARFGWGSVVPSSSRHG